MRVLIAVGLLVASAPALCADWKPITTLANGQMHLYIDLDSKDTKHTADGLLVTAWVMTDFGGPVDGMSSTKTLWTHNCEKHTAKWIRVVNYSGPNATGNEFPGKENSNATFKPIVPHSIGDTVSRNLCN
jgi:hypothetical protein